MVADNMVSSVINRKNYGQYFTPPTIAALASAAAIKKTNISIIDPMCGNGNMLSAACDRLSYLGDNQSSMITGIEIDPLLVKKIPDNNYCTTRIICADAFIKLSGLLTSGNSLLKDHKYDVIIGNPPYVRYQNLAPLLLETSSELMNVFKNEINNKSNSFIASTIIRACLISNLIPNLTGDYQKTARSAISLIHSKSNNSNYNDIDKLWLKIVCNYSGLADLSLPAWLLTWRISKPGTIISFVTSSSWKNREYARVLRYFMLRFLQPLIIIEQEGNSWFGDAQIPTSLMVFKVRISDDIAIPLINRNNNHKIKILTIKRDYDISQFTNLKNIALSINPNCVPRSNEEISTYADVIMNEISEQNQNKKYDFGNLNILEEKVLINDLLQEDNIAHRSGATGICLEVLEDINGYTHSEILKKPISQYTIPNSIFQILDVKSIPNDAFCSLNDFNISVNQGLRTGCNPFFYVQKLSEADWNHLLPDYDSELILSILNKPTSDPNKFLQIIDSFKKINSIIPVESPDNCPSSTAVKLSPEFGNRLAIFPKSCLKPALRYQNNLTNWSITDVNSIKNYVIVTESGATLNDYFKIQKYPKYWVEVWKNRDGLSMLPSGLSEYISQGSITKLERNGRSVTIPELSAVAPNIRILSIPHNYQLNLDETSVPRIPAWWYTLPIQIRHYGSIFIPRVNDSSVCAYLNNPDNPILIDANFSTITIRNEKMPLTALYAILNSTWVNAVLETIATPMGGGSLKVEASHLRLLPIPNFEYSSIIKLKKLGIELSQLPKSRDKPYILNEIDKIVTGYIADKLHVKQSTTFTNLEEYTNELRLRRKC